MKRCYYLTFIFMLASLFMGCDPALESCCLSYVYYDDDAHRDDAFEQMCLNAMTYDKKYDLNYDCKLREVDKYVDAAILCCAPLKAQISTLLLDDSVFSPADWTVEDTQLLLPLLDKIFSSRAADKYSPFEIYSYDPYTDSKNMIWGGSYTRTSACTKFDDATGEYSDCNYKYKLPMNAYTWCLLNTNPQTYACDLDRAREFEKSLRACCHGDDISCISSYIKNNGNCVNASEGE